MAVNFCSTPMEEERLERWRSEHNGVCGLYDPDNPGENDRRFSYVLRPLPKEHDRVRPFAGRIVCLCGAEYPFTDETAKGVKGKAAEAV